MFVPVVVAATGTKVVPQPLSSCPLAWQCLQFNIYFSGDQRGIEIMRIIRVALQRLAKKLYPRHYAKNTTKKYKNIKRKHIKN